MISVVLLNSTTPVSRRGGKRSASACGRYKEFTVFLIRLAAIGSVNNVKEPAGNNILDGGLYVHMGRPWPRYSTEPLVSRTACS
jgi:hypothetical protein